RKGRKVWTVAQLQTFLQRARSDRFFALWVLEATSGMRRCELAGARRDLLDLDAGTLSIEVTQVVWTAGWSSQTAKRKTLSTCWRGPVHARRAEGGCREARSGAARARPVLPRSWCAVLLGGRQASAPGHDHAAVQAARRRSWPARDRPARRPAQLRHRGP